MQPRVLIFAGSARKNSFNRQLAILAEQEVRQAGGEPTLLELREYPLPLYDGDLEAELGIPDNARKLKQLMVQHQALLIVSPEYNSSITPLLKNVIDWVSRKEGDEPALVAYQNKVAALLSASPGALGGLRGLVHLRSILGNIGVLVVPNQLAISNAGSAFLPDGMLSEEKTKKSLASVAQALVATAGKMHRNV